MSSYAHLLKQFLKFLDIKFIVLANALGYDTSYISKWCNGIKTPSLKSVSTIHKQMSVLFAKEILLQNKANTFFLEFNLEIPEEKEMIKEISFLENSIFSLLNKVYKLKNSNPDFEEKDNFHFIFGKNDTIHFLEEKLRNILSKTSHSKFEFYLTTDLTIINLQPLFSLLDFFKKKNINIYVHLGIDLKEFDISSDKKLKNIFNLINRYANLNIELYDNFNFKNLNILLLKNEMALQYSLNKNGDFQAFTVIEKKDTLNNISSIILNSFKEKDKLWQSFLTKKILKDKYRTIFYSSDFFNFFLVYGFEFLMPPSIIENIVNYAKKENYSEQEQIAILRVKIAWEEIFEKSSINFFILKSALLHYLEKGKLIYVNVPYQTSIEERQEHYEYAIKILEKNPHIHLYILDDDIFNKNNIPYNIGVFCNRKKIFFKNYHSLEEKIEPYFTNVNNKKMISQINLLFEKLKKSDYCREYSVEELKILWEKYSNMFFRLGEINK